MIGVRLLTVPRDVTIVTQSPDGWISAFFGLVIALIAGAVTGLLAQMFPHMGYFEFVPRIIGRIPGYILTTGYIAYFTMFAASELRIMGEVVRFYLLANTPLEFISVMMMLSVLYLLYGGLRPLVRIQQLFLPVILFITMLLILMSFSTFEFKNLLPVMAKGILPIIKGMPQTTFANLGFATIMIFSAYMIKPQDTVKSVLTAIAIAAGINVVIIFLAIGMIDYRTIATLVFPVMEMVRTIQTPGGFLERLESVFLAIFIMAIFSSIAILLFVCSLGLRQLYQFQERKNLLVLVPLATFLALLPKDLNQAFGMGNAVEKLGIFYVGTVPAFLFLIAKIRNLGIHRKPASQQETPSEEDSMQC